MHIFIDANIFCGFFELASDSLAELEKLIAVINTGGATLWLPEQAKREFWKNRENNIKKHVRDFEQHRALGNPPLLVRENPKFAELARLAKRIDKQRREIATLVKREVDSQNTHADKIIRKLFGIAKPIDTDNDVIFNAAWRRAQCHLPPGTKDDLGDRLCWVGLLSELPNGAELHVVSDDTDYQNEGFSADVRPYLDSEWRGKKNGNIKLWNRISQFLAANFPDAKNALEMERGILAQRLRKSGSFAQTHTIIAQLNSLDGFNDEQLRHIAEAIVENSQVRAIRGDPDVHAFYKSLIAKYRGHLDKDLEAKIDELLESGRADSLQ
jgi:hypothetical protein